MNHPAPSQHATPMPSDGATPTKTPKLPQIHLLCMISKFGDAFNTAVEKYFPSLRDYTNIAIHNCRLSNFPQDIKIDAIVSPANSYARLDGAFDDAISRELSPKDDYDWVTRKAQQVLYKKWRGYAPPGTCTVVSIEPDEAETKEKNKWGCNYILLCPTMRIPWEVKWDREVAYECVWSLLCAVDTHNKDLKAVGKQPQINNILMTPLGTGVGRISAERWAGQCVLAMKHWVEAVENPETWQNLEWEKIFEGHEEVVSTYRDEI